MPTKRQAIIAFFGVLAIIVIGLLFIDHRHSVKKWVGEKRQSISDIVKDEPKDEELLSYEELVKFNDELVKQVAELQKKVLDLTSALQMAQQHASQSAKPAKPQKKNTAPRVIAESDKLRQINSSAESLYARELGFSSVPACEQSQVNVFIRPQKMYGYMPIGYSYQRGKGKARSGSRGYIIECMEKAQSFTFNLCNNKCATRLVETKVVKGTPVGSDPQTPVQIVVFREGRRFEHSVSRNDTVYVGETELAMVDFSPKSLLK